MKSRRRDLTLMENALSWSAHGTCSRLQVGAVISREGRPFCTGYNGAPAGMPHCDHRECTCRYPDFQLGGDPECKKHGACRTAVHAEANALAFAARYGVATEGAELHTTHQPCLTCAMSIINAGIIRVVFLNPYRDNGGLLLLHQAELTAEKLVR